ncbi:hypothetical protein P7D15_00515 [Bacillus cereus]|uniref:hypothetical protein n=1 Tax=Bacillus cereus TaxID=1396 RepID=UPI0024072060|nr:hypothetical protein [Bacillus cereus]MDF9598929.1 hypothetical protein [Bacillus cereus]MDG1589262.1 hypothetical protein [Bacillus cereus]
MSVSSFIADVIAKRCMGWKEIERPFSEENWNPIRVYVDKEGREIMEVRKFNPLRKEGQAFMILDELKKQHVKFSIGVNEKQTAYNFKIFDKGNNVIHEKEHVDMIAVICLGVLAWSGITITSEIAGAVDIEVIS